MHPSAKMWHIVSVLVVVVSVVLVYGAAVRNGFVSWDDDVMIQRGVRTLMPRGLAAYPVFHASLRMDQALWGLSPRAVHAGNVALHAINALLVYALVCRLLRACGRQAVLGGLAAALLFALHPMNVEPVAWASGRKILLAGTFGLLALLAWTTEPRGPLLRAGALVAFALACLSNAVALGLAPVFIAHEVLIRDRRLLRGILATADMLLLAGAAAAARLLLVTHERAGERAPLDRARALLSDLWAFLSPLHLANTYGAFSTAVVLLGGGALLAAGLIVRRERRGAVAFGGAWFILALLPVLGHATGRGDRHIYLASIGACLALGALLLRAKARRSALLVALAAALCLGALSARQVRAWRTSRTLWSNQVRVAGATHAGMNNLGLLFAESGLPRPALALYRRGIAIGSGSSDLFFNAANAFAQIGRNEAAETYYRLAISRAPEHAGSRLNLGVLLERTGRRREAEAVYRDLTVVRPDYAPGWHNLGVLLRETERPQEARAMFMRALEADPSFAPARNALRPHPAP